MTASVAGPTENVSEAGVGSSLPARSRAFTWIVCEPGAGGASVAVVADENADHAPSSSRQANSSSPDGVRLSAPPKPKRRPSVVRSGPVMNVPGGVLSTVITRLRLVTLPARSVARATTV